MFKMFGFRNLMREKYVFKKIGGISFQKEGTCHGVFLWDPIIDPPYCHNLSQGSYVVPNTRCLFIAILRFLNSNRDPAPFGLELSSILKLRFGSLGREKFTFRPIRLFQRFEGRYYFSAHRGRELRFKDTHFGISEYPTNFATEMNSNSLIMCSRVINVRLGYLKRVGLFVNKSFFFFFFISFFWYEALFELYHFLRSSSIEHIIIDLCFSTTRKIQHKNPAYSFSPGSSPVTCLALKALTKATLTSAQLP
jgi:hypothetical protein